MVRLKAKIIETGTTSTNDICWRSLILRRILCANDFHISISKVPLNCQINLSKPLIFAYINFNNFKVCSYSSKDGRSVATKEVIYWDIFLAKDLNTPLHLERFIQQNQRICNITQACNTSYMIMTKIQLTLIGSVITWGGGIIS